MTAQWLAVCWIVATVAFTGWIDNHRHIVTNACASGREWARHPECNPDRKQIIRTTT